MKKILLPGFLLCMIQCMAFSQKLGIGISNPEGLLHIKGNMNGSQLIIDAAPSQNYEYPLAILRSSNGTDLLWIHSDHESNAFIGYGAGRVNSVTGTPQTGNTFVGSRAGFNNNYGTNNTAVGRGALQENTSGYNNTAMGYDALGLHSGGHHNSAMGYTALFENYGNYNSGCGSLALYNTTYSSYNVAVGYAAGYLYDHGWNNLFFGAEADASAAGLYNMIAFGNIATCTDVSQARIGNSYTYSIGGYEDWSNISDGRFKKNVEANVPGLIFINKLRPVTYKLDVSKISERLNEDRGHEMRPEQLESILQKEQILQSGFIAQEVEVAARSVGYDFSGVDVPGNEMSLYGLRYAEFVVPLVKAVQELQQKLEKLKEENIELKELELELTKLKESYSKL